MDDTDDFLSSFSAASDDEKRDSFAVSTLSLVLGQLGASAADIRGFKNELGAEFGFDWFNSRGFISPHLASDRCFSFNLQLGAVFGIRRTHPVVLMYERALAEIATDTKFCLIFKCFELGRLIATDCDVNESTHVRIKMPDFSFNIVPFKGFFSARYSTVLG